MAPESAKVALRDHQHDLGDSPAEHVGSLCIEDGCGGGVRGVALSGSASTAASTAAFTADSQESEETAAIGRGSTFVPLAVFLFFTLSRAVHPLIIEQTKVEVPVSSAAEEFGGASGGGGGPVGMRRTFLHEPISVPLMECVVTLLITQCMCLWHGGFREWCEIWRPAPLRVFSFIGLLYSFGDLLELQSLGNLSGVMYQVLSQSKLVVTAVMIWVIKGKKQSGLQWILLVLLMLSLICFTVMKDVLHKHHLAEQTEATQNPAPPLAAGAISFGVLMGFLKVGVSCLCAVLSDKYIKDFASVPIHIQLAQFKVLWLLSLLAMVFWSGGEKIQSEGFFHDWSPAVVGSLASFTIKDWSTMILLAVLDSMYKNLGEACTVLVTYLLAGLHPNSADETDFEVFITLVVVLGSVAAYLSAGEVVAKAELYDRAHSTKEVISA